MFAIFGVIMIHQSTPLSKYWASDMTSFQLSFINFLGLLWSWGVPIFVMLTGALLLNPKKEITIKTLLVRYFLRIVVAIALFGTICSCMKLLKTTGASFNLNLLWTAIVNTAQGNTWAYLWYLYMLAGLYLLIPFVKIFISNVSNNVLLYTMLVLFIFNSIFPTIETISGFKFGIELPVNSIYLFYLLLGSYLHANDIKCSKAILIPTLIISLIVVATNFMHLYDYNSPFIVMQAICVFLLTKQYINRPFKIANWLAPNIFGIYLIHPFFLNFLHKQANFTPTNYSVYLVLIVSLITTITLSVTVVHIARKVPIIKKWF